MSGFCSTYLWVLLVLLSFPTLIEGGLNRLRGERLRKRKKMLIQTNTHILHPLKNSSNINTINFASVSRAEVQSQFWFSVHTVSTILPRFGHKCLPFGNRKKPSRSKTPSPPLCPWTWPWLRTCVDAGIPPFGLEGGPGFQLTPLSLFHDRLQNGDQVKNTFSLHNVSSFL